MSFDAFEFQNNTGINADEALARGYVIVDDFLRHEPSKSTKLTSDPSDPEAWLVAVAMDEFTSEESRLVTLRVLGAIELREMAELRKISK